MDPVVGDLGRLLYLDAVFFLCLPHHGARAHRRPCSQTATVHHLTRNQTF